MKLGDKIKNVFKKEIVYVIIYVIGVLSCAFYLKIFGNINQFLLINVLIIVYYVNVTYFFSNIVCSNMYTEKYADYVKIQYIPLTGLWSLLILRLNLNIFFSLFISTVFLFFIGYSRSYFSVEEFIRLSSVSVSLCFQIYLGSGLYVSLFSLFLIIVYGRLTSEFIDKFVILEKYLYNNKTNLYIFYKFVNIYIKISLLRLGKRAIIFNFLMFTLFPTVWIFFLFDRIYIPVIVMFFMTLFLLSASAYVKFIKNPLISVWLLNFLKQRYPKNFQKKIDEITHVVLLKEKYYIIDSEKYGVFSGSWLVKNYMEMKQREIKYWADLYIEDYSTLFIKCNLGYIRDDLDGELDNLFMKGLNYIKNTGNMEKNTENYYYGKAVDILMLNKDKKELKAIFWQEMFVRLLNNLDVLDKEFLKAVSMYAELNKGKGINGEPLLRSPGSSYFVSNHFITII